MNSQYDSKRKADSSEPVLDCLRPLSPAELARTKAYLDGPEWRRKVEEALEEGRRALEAIESNPFRNCMPGCYV